MNYDSFPKDIQGEWARFRQQLATFPLPPGKDVYMPIFDNGILFPLQRINEMEVMMQTARSVNPHVVMEIGSDKGGGFFHWCKSLPSVGRAIAAEFRGVPFQDAFKDMFPEIDFHFVEGSSYDPVNVQGVRNFLNKGKTGSEPGDMIDCLFIDGDKNGTGRDFASYVSMVRPGGLIFIHDIEDRTIHPSQFFYSLCEKYRIMAILDGREALPAVRRGVNNEPPKTAYEGWLRIWKHHSCGVGVVQV